jgi:tRNA-splicing ligase RtcB
MDASGSSRGGAGSAWAYYQETGDSTGVLSPPGMKGKPITVIGNAAVRRTFDDKCLEQAVNSRSGPGVTELVLNPDAHMGYGAPIGCVLVSPTHIYPGPVGVDIKCSMSLLQFDLPASEIEDRRTRRALIDAVCERIPTGVGKGQRNVPKSRRVGRELGLQAVVEGGSREVCAALGIPETWAQRCEDSHHRAHDGSTNGLRERIARLRAAGEMAKLDEKLSQLGSLGGGNHFGEGEIVEVADDPRAREIAAVFGLRDGHVAYFTHCGSRGFGHDLAFAQFKRLQAQFKKRGIPFPGGDRELVHAELGTAEANDYLDDMALGANFATVNHLLINALVVEAFTQVIPGVRANFVYFISHNIARREPLDGRDVWVHRKGATRAFPAGHPELARTPFARTGHPILLPGNPLDGSAVMVAEPGARLSCYSVNHGAGRQLGRRRASRTLDQKALDLQFAEADVLTNCRKYPRDEAPIVYKPFEEVLNSVKGAGLAREVARLRARFVIKDASKPDD